MKAVYRSRYGSPEVLELRQQPSPTPGPDEVLVGVHASTVNRTDCGGLWGKPFVYRFFTGLRRPKRSATGTDFAGEILAVGRDVKGFRKGERVWGFDDNLAGSHAQEFTYSTRKALRHIPEGIPYEQAVASAEGAHYAINFINKLALAPGQRVLVNGATGAIGSAAVQLLKLCEVEVVAVCPGAQAARVLELGADRVIDCTRTDFTQQAEVYDVVFDAVGKSRFATCKGLLRPKGVYISSELGPGGENLYLSLFSLFSRGKRVVFPFPANIGASLDQMNPLLASGRFRPLIDRRYPLEQIREAFTYVAAGQKIGNVILTFE